VFLADDHPFVRRAFEALIAVQPDLELCGQAADVPTALARMLSNPPDLAVIDLALERGTGYDLIVELRAHCPLLKILVVSMQDRPTAILQALRLGANGYLTKDEGAARLIEAMQAVLRGRLYLGHTAAARLRSSAFGGRLHQAPRRLTALDQRELELLTLLGQGATEEQIAQRLHEAPAELEHDTTRIARKLGCRSATELSQRAVRWLDHAAWTAP
jgi:two-component system response regulator DevR